MHTRIQLQVHGGASSCDPANAIAAVNDAAS
jgi:hypothetical protein